MGKEQVMHLFEQYFPPEIRMLAMNYMELFDAVQEIRCRVEQPLFLRTKQGQEILVLKRFRKEQMQHLISRISQGSSYAWEEEYRRGYLTLPGGHRVGLTGKAVLEKGTVRTMTSIHALNVRIARAVPGAADSLMEKVLFGGIIHNTLLLSPPGCGKTTVLRDIVRQLSDGIPRLQFQGVQVSVVDERSELAGCVSGIPQLEIGCRTDVLDGCPKQEGIPLMLRSMGPQVIAMDEIGTEEDAAALEAALQSGVAIMTTAHGNNLDELLRHPVLHSLAASEAFPLIVRLFWKDGQVQLQYERRPDA